MNPRIENPNRLTLPPETTSILQKLFPTHTRIIIEQALGGGFSLGQVFAVWPFKEQQVDELRAVIKMAPSHLIQQEKWAYHTYIDRRLPNKTSLQGEAILEDLAVGGLLYTLAGWGTFQIESLYNYLSRVDRQLTKKTMKRLFDSMSELWKSHQVLQQSFPLQGSYDPILPVNLIVKPLATRTPSPVNPYHLTPATIADYDQFEVGSYIQIDGFEISKIEADPISGQQDVTITRPHPGNGGLPNSYRIRLQFPKAHPLDHYQWGGLLPQPCIGQIVATRNTLLKDSIVQLWGASFNTTQAEIPLTLSNKTIHLPNPLLAYTIILDQRIEAYLAPIHGDLNLENILVDSELGDIRLIDFSDTRYDHILHDLLRLEVGIITRRLPDCLSQVDYHPAVIYRLYEQLHYQGNQPLTNYPSSWSTELQTIFDTLFTLRQTARDYLAKHDDYTHYYQGLTLYLLGTLKFNNLTPEAKRLAFWGAAIACYYLQLGDKALVTENNIYSVFNIPEPTAIQTDILSEAVRNLPDQMTILQKRLRQTSSPIDQVMAQAALEAVEQRIADLPKWAIASVKSVCSFL
ncbi:MAG: phosphotransferase [Chloroflexota bacterium]